MAIDLIKELKNKKISFGLKTVIKQAKKNIPQKVFIASDFPCLKIQELQTDIGKNKNTEIKQLDITTEQIQEICKKPFRASVISIPKEESEEKAEPSAGAKKETEKKKTKSKAGKKPKKKTAKEKPGKKEAEKTQKEAKKAVKKIVKKIKPDTKAKTKKKK